MGRCHRIAYFLTLQPMAHQTPTSHILAAELTELMAEHPLGSEISRTQPRVHACLVDQNDGIPFYLAEYDPIERTALAYLSALGEHAWQYIRIDPLQALTDDDGTCRVEIDYLFEPCAAYHFAD